MPNTVILEYCDGCLTDSCACLAAVSDSSKINMVKDGALNFDETKTINDVFKNNQLPGNQDWEYFEAKDGSQVVKFKADLAHEKLNSSFKEFLAKVVRNPLVLLGLSGGRETRGQCAFPFIFVLKDFVWSD